MQIGATREIFKAECPREAPHLIRIPIRPDAEIAVQFPRDITKAEAEKVARVLAAYAEK